MDIEDLLAPRSADPPSGANLEYDDTFMAMEIAARPGQERQAGDTILEAEEPDHSDIRTKALAVLERSHDLRAGVTLAGSALHTDGLPGFAQATAYVRGCLDRYWDTCHPQLDAEDDDDPTMRINAVQALAAPDPVLRGLRGLALTDSRAFGRISLRDVLAAQGLMTLPEGEVPAHDSATIAGAFRDTDPDTLAATLDSARAAQGDLDAIEALFSERTPGQGPRLSEAVKLLRQIAQQVAAATGADTPAEGEALGDSPAAAAASGPGVPGQVASQAEVLRALDAVIAYYRRAEPSSPVPLLLERAKRLVGANFLDIVEDMAPNGVDNVRLIGGLGHEE